MNKIDKQQVNELVHCKVSLFKNDLVHHLRRLIENNELNNLFDFGKKINDQKTRLFMKKRKFSSSEDDEEQENSNSLDSDDKLNNYDALNINQIMNNCKSNDEEDKEEDDRTIGDLKCDEKLIDKDVHSIENHYTNQSNSLFDSQNNEFSFYSSRPTAIHQPAKSQLTSILKNNFELIEKSFNEKFLCLNGVSVQLIGNIKLQLTTPQNGDLSNKQLANNWTDTSQDRCLNNNLLMISKCLKNENQITSQPNSLSSASDSMNKNSKFFDNENGEIKANKSNIDKSMKDENKKVETIKFDKEDCNKISEQLINQQLSASNDSSTSTLSAVSIDYLQTNVQQPSSQSSFSESNLINLTNRRRSSSSTTSASSDRDFSVQPNRKHLKIEEDIPQVLKSNQSLDLITSINSSINLEPLPSPYLSPPSLPHQQMNGLLSPTDSLFKTKKSHLKLDKLPVINSNKLNEDKLNSPNFHKKFNAISSPKTTASNSTPIKNANHFANHSISNTMTTTTTIPNRKTEIVNNEMKKILKSYQEIASNSLNGPEYYENLAMLANFHQHYGVRTLDPFIAKVANAANAFLNGSGPVPDAQLLMNELTKLPFNKSEDAKSEIANLSINNLNNYLSKKSTELINSQSTYTSQIKSIHEKETGKLSSTILENERISCFNVAGEERLCLPQILTTVLRSFTLHDINNVCDQFQIFCSRCNTEQLNMLKAANILPPGAPSCGLITKSDAERLCAMLFFYANLFPSQMQVKVKDPYSMFSSDHQEKQQLTPEDLQPKLKMQLKESQFILDLIKEIPDEIRQLVYEDQPLNRLQKIQALKSTLSFKVMHHCFGKCKGLLIPAFYLRYNSRCILCLECESLLSPHKFVLHTHKFNENQTCHWGFDSSNWRNLITLTKEDQSNPKMDILKKYLNEFKFHRIP